jgi:hypothetical protein
LIKESREFLPREEKKKQKILTLLYDEILPTERNTIHWGRILPISSSAGGSETLDSLIYQMMVKV